MTPKEASKSVVARIRALAAKVARYDTGYGWKVRQAELLAIAEAVEDQARVLRRYRDDPRQAVYDPTLVLTRVASALAPEEGK